jgi:hypothetical protein
MNGFNLGGVETASLNPVMNSHFRSRHSSCGGLVLVVI